MTILDSIGATGERPTLWAFSITGIITGGAIGAVASFGLANQYLTTNFGFLSAWTLLGWIAGLVVGGAVGVAGGRFAESWNRRRQVYGAPANQSHRHRH